MNLLKAALAWFFIINLFCPFLYASWQEDLQRGINEYRSENYEEAFEYLYKARQDNRSSPVVAFYLGLVYKQTGDYPKASEYFEEALRLKPPVVEAYGELIEMLYSLDRTKDALHWISKAEQQGIEPGKIGFLKGLVYNKINEPDKAIEAFQKVKRDDPRTSQAADLQIAIAYTKQRKISQAIQSLKAVVSSNPNTDIAQFAREYENAFTKSMEGYRPLRLSAALSYLYDTNVTAKPSTDVGLPPSEEKDSAIMGNLNINFNPLTEGNLYFSAQYALSGTFYRKLSDYNSLSQSVTITPGYNLNWGFASIPISYNHNLLNGKGYMALSSVKPTLGILSSTGQILSLSLGYSHRNMLQEPYDSDEERDANILQGGVGYMYPFSDGRGLLSIRGEYVIDNAKGVNWKNKGTRFNVSLIVPVREKVDLLFSGDAFMQDYKNEHTIFLVKRSDKTYTLNAGFSWEFVRSFYVNSQVIYTKAQSNIPLYDYQKFILSAGLEYRF